jgi:formylglycine-generating enzyme required for sulfatase activity
VEHEAMHQETLLYMWHRLPLEQKIAPGRYQPKSVGAPPRQEWVDVPGGRATLGVNRGSIDFGWDNEFPAYAVDVESFAIERHDVTNQRFLEFVEAGGYQDERWWSPQDWAWVNSERIEHPRFWERIEGVWH